jgi:hypothetical protein
MLPVWNHSCSCLICRRMLPCWTTCAGKPAHLAVPGDYTLGAWQLHTHPDLIGRFRELAPGWPLTSAYGVPLLASEGIATVVALGTDWLAVRTGHLPPGIETGDPDPAWSFAHGDWHIVSPWQSHLPSAEGTRILRELVSAALDHAASLTAT